MAKLFWWILAIALICFGCAGRRKARAATVTAGGWTERGVASWYGYPYHGRRAASGEVYDMDQMTAAHRTLGFGALVRVLNLDNGRTVDVRINDRGPFAEGRVIDLSRAAAIAIGMIGPGTAPVLLRLVSGPPPPPPGGEAFGVQVGAFRDKRNADRFRDLMEKEHGAARLVSRDGDTALWRVVVGRFPTEEAARAFAERLGTAYRGAFIVRLDDLR